MTADNLYAHLRSQGYQIFEKAGGRLGILRGAGDALQRQFGTAAVQILHEALDDAQREITSSLGESQEGEHDVPDPP